ncbi:NAD-dependent epimerase/dehydratase family protein [Micrococcus terreus]|uniref:NAD-dependent epimerase/dehydratase family protein n=1 Tax=Micrococcus terreus TaxID=574650 RepID=UPI00254FB3DF|nr:NAD-dependent epimerase/dehydratase family protein [Micrococcus terreus]MDK7702140.1 NAD-dependent epimerase/dehydratase family protein [Micrococcus terreus]WOO98958.1 NAD-dependent epimerase/dehydratase family protein [Micrococcus terreus]
MRVVVLGATGNVATALLHRLQAAAEIGSLVGVSRRGPDRGGPPYEGVEWHRIDVSEESAGPELEAVMRGADAVIDLVWVIRPNRDRDHLREVNVRGNERVFQAAAAAGVPHLVYASSVGAYGPGPKDRAVDESHPTTGTPSSHYAAQKAEVEDLLDQLERENPDMLVTRLRPGLIFQAGAAPEIKDYFLGDLVPAGLVNGLRVPVLPFPAGLRFQAVSAQDVAEAYWQVVRQSAGGAFNVAAEPVLDAQTVGQLLGAKRYLELPTTVFRAAAALTYAARLQPTDPGWLDMAANVPVMDTSAIREAVGWTETSTSQQAVRELLDHMNAAEGLGNAQHRSSSPLE